LQQLVQNLPVYAFRKAFSICQVGEGAAISVTLFLMLILWTIVYFRIYRREAEA